MASVALSSAAVLAVLRGWIPAHQDRRGPLRRAGRRTAARCCRVLPAAAPPVTLAAGPSSRIQSRAGEGQKTIRPAVARVPAKKAAPPDVALPSVASPAPSPVPVVELAASRDRSARACAPVPAKPHYKDGTYLGWGTSRHGDIQASVVIEDGRILSATIAQCLTQILVQRDRHAAAAGRAAAEPETDYVSGATQSTNAFYYAVVDALSKAK